MIVLAFSERVEEPEGKLMLTGLDDIGAAVLSDAFGLNTFAFSPP